MLEVCVGLSGSVSQGVACGSLDALYPSADGDDVPATEALPERDWIRATALGMDIHRTKTENYRTVLSKDD